MLFFYVKRSNYNVNNENSEEVELHYILLRENKGWNVEGVAHLEYCELY